MTQRRIVLVGFMGCGKTTVAKELARHLDCDFVDLDTFITESLGQSPAEIIQTEGEAIFRKLETRALEDVLNRSELRVIALGGGTWTMETNRTMVARQDSLSVWLDAPFDLCWKRIISSGDTVRPLAPDRDAAKTLFESRRADYGLAQLRIRLTSETELTEILDKIVTNSVSSSHPN